MESLSLFIPYILIPQILRIEADGVNLAGLVGDLFVSELKRAAGIKDSGTIFPGHGGMLDRIDALLFATPVAYYFKILFLSGG